MRERLKIAVCDDEPRALTIVSSSIGTVFSEAGMDVSLETFLGPEALLEALSTRSFQLVFLDISMPKMDGITLGKTIQKLGSGTSIVFVSNQTDRMFDTFAAEPFGFVRKNHFMGDLNQIVTRYLEKLKIKDQGDLVRFQDGRNTVSIDASRVTYIECIRNTQELHFEDPETQRKIYSRMETLEEALKPYGFLRIHKGYLVNSRFITSFGVKSLTLSGGAELPIGRSYYHDAKIEYLDYVTQSGAAYISRSVFRQEDTP